MKATTFIAAKGLAYAVNIIKSAPSNATQWNEGYEFKCGQNAATISPQDREKYFVDLSDLKRLVESVEYIMEFGGLEAAKHHQKYCDKFKLYVNPRLKQNIADYESIYGGEHV